MLLLIGIGALLALQDGTEVENLLQQARAAEGRVTKSVAEQILTIDPHGSALRGSLDLEQAGWLARQALAGDESAGKLLKTAWVLGPREARALVDSLFVPGAESDALERYGELLVPQLAEDLRDPARRDDALRALDRLGAGVEQALIAALASDDPALLAPVAGWLATRGGLRAAAELRARQMELPEGSPPRLALDEAWAELCRRWPEFEGRDAGALFRALAEGLDRGEVAPAAEAEWTLDETGGVRRFPRFGALAGGPGADPGAAAVVKDAVVYLERAAAAGEGAPASAGDGAGAPAASPAVDEVVVFYGTDRSYADITLGWCLRGLVPWLVGLVLALVLHFGWKLVIRDDWQVARKHLRRLLIAAVCVHGLIVAKSVVLDLQKRARLGQGYTDERDPALAAARGEEPPPGALGRCRVSVPRAERRQMGELNGPGVLSLDLREDPRSHFVLLGIEPQPDAARFFDDVRRDAARGNSAFVFVHGYNVSFEDAARRTAQLKVDLQFDGAAAFYSWPSGASAFEYTRDESSIEWAIPHLYAFLLRLRRELPDARIHLIAHSMGNRALAGALLRFTRELDARAAAARQRGFDEVVLAAPDLDAETFRDELFPAMRRGAGGFTLYACEKDKALVFSAGLHGWKRAGQQAADFATLAGLESIEVALDTSLLDDVLALGHSYYGDVSTVLADLRLTLAGRGPASAEREHGGLTFRPAGFWSLAGGLRSAGEP